MYSPSSLRLSTIQTTHAFSLPLADEVPEPELLPEADEPDRAGNAFSAAYADPAAALYTGEAIASPAMARKMEVDFIFRTVRGFYLLTHVLVICEYLLIDIIFGPVKGRREILP